MCTLTHKEETEIKGQSIILSIKQHLISVHNLT